MGKSQKAEGLNIVNRAYFTAITISVTNVMISTEILVEPQDDVGLLDLFISLFGAGGIKVNDMDEF
jgi:hypothetical protein